MVTSIMSHFYTLQLSDLIPSGLDEDGQGGETGLLAELW